MKKLINFFKKNLTHKILPILAVFLLVFNMFFISSVSAYFEFTNLGGYYHHISDLPDGNTLPDGSTPIFIYLSNVSSWWESIAVCYTEGAYFKIDGIEEGSGRYIIHAYDSSGNRVPVRVFGKYLDRTNWQDNLTYDTLNYNPDVFSDNDTAINGVIYNYDGSIFYSNVELVTPTIESSDLQIAHLYGDLLYINPGDFESDNTLDFSIQHLDISGSYATVFSCSLNKDTPYYLPFFNWETGEYSFYKYCIAYKSMGDFVVGDTYRFVVTYALDSGISGRDFVDATMVYRNIADRDSNKNPGDNQDENDNVIKDINNSINQGFTDLKVGFGESTNQIIESNNKTQESLNEQTNAIKENTETNKNIFQKIGDILNLLNPFSKDFFAYKLIELLLEALKSLFIPSDDFFNNWLADLNTYFGDRFGILYYPFEVVIDFLTRFISACNSMSSSNAIINIPELRFMGVTLISAFVYDFNTLLANDTLKTIHDIYLVVIDVMFSLMLVCLAKNTFSEVFGGRFSDEIVGDVRDEISSPSSSSKSYKRYEQQRYNQVYYNSIHKKEV